MTVTTIPTPPQFNSDPEQQEGIFRRVCGRVTGGPDRFGSAWQRFRSIAANYLERQKLMGDSPKLAALRTPFRRFRKIAPSMRDVLASMAQSLDDGFGGATDGVLASGRDADRGNGRALAGRIRTYRIDLERLSADVEDHIDRWFETSGGKLKVYGNKEGPPKRRLVEDCLAFFREFCIGDPRPSGEFFDTCSDCLELAEGDAVEGAGLEPYITDVLAAAKKANSVA